MLVNMSVANTVHSGEIDESSDDCSDVGQAVPIECVDRHSDSQVSVTVMMLTSQACQSGCVFFTDIGVDCCVADGFMDRWHPDIVVKVLHAQRAYNSWKASLVPDVCRLC